MNESKVEKSVSVVIETLNGRERVMRNDGVEFFKVVRSDEERRDGESVVGENVIVVRGR